MEDAASEIESITAAGNPHAQSLLGFLYNLGLARVVVRVVICCFDLVSMFLGRIPG
ncbi:hypothetical protein Hanom_Chr16g01459931 [Helianthus anomalus]